MAKKDLVPRRGRVSKFEPYDVEILTMLEAGMQMNVLIYLPAGREVRER